VVVAEVKTANTEDEKNVEQEGSFFPCFYCGICCSDFQPHLEMQESKTIADHLGMSLQQFIDDCTDPRWPGTDTHLLLHKDGKCLFLDQQGKAKWFCRIHTFKPEACRQWTAGLSRKECRRGLSRYWELTVDDSGELTGSAEKLSCFQKFLKTLN
jgi:Fe-S-cluster containining protein